MSHLVLSDRSDLILLFFPFYCRPGSLKQEAEAADGSRRGRQIMVLPWQQRDFQTSLISGWTHFSRRCPNVYCLICCSSVFIQIGILDILCLIPTPSLRCLAPRAPSVGLRSLKTEPSSIKSRRISVGRCPSVGPNDSAAAFPPSLAVAGIPKRLPDDRSPKTHSILDTHEPMICPVEGSV